MSKALIDTLFGNGIQLVTQVRRNMKKVAPGDEERILLRKRSVIETVNDQPKDIAQAEHTRHRSPSGFLLNLAGAIAAYSFLPRKPSIRPILQETNPRLIAEFDTQLRLAD